MRFFVLQVQTGGEDKFLRHLDRRYPDLRPQFFWPRRSLRIKRKGVWRNSLAPIFPGYLFLRTGEVDPGLFQTVRRIPGFYRFLDSNQNIVPLGPDDTELIRHFLSFGEVVDRSLAYFDENRRIRIVSGPLKGLEGKIVKVDRRKGRAKVALELYKESFQIDFGYESLEAAPEQNQTAQAG